MRFLAAIATIFCIPALAALSPARAQDAYVLAPDRVFDGETMHPGWRVRVEGGRIIAAGPSVETAGAELIDLSGMTLLPGLIEAHAHVLLHPYDETNWNDQVLRESVAERSVRAANHLEAALNSGYTTLRDLGSEGAGYADVGLKQALAKGVIAGPRLVVAGPALVASGAYGPSGFREGVVVPQGAVEVSGRDDIVAETRRQISGGADWVKVYADYRWGPDGAARPTFSLEELQLIVETAASSGRLVVAHAATDEGMRRAIEAGVATIEHGDGGSAETYRLMERKGVAICPTLAAVEATARYQGWDGGAETAPERIKVKRDQMARILAAKAPLCAGSDVGVFDHGDSAWELDLLAAYGAPPLAVLKAATSGNAKILRLDNEIGAVKAGLAADLVAAPGDPLADVSSLRHIAFVMKGGEIIAHP